LENAIDAAVSKICDEAFNVTFSTLTEHRPIVDEIVKRLLVKETVDGFELREIVKEITGKEAPAFADITSSAQEALNAMEAQGANKTTA
jgi:hypothetical protein